MLAYYIDKFKLVKRTIFPTISAIFSANILIDTTHICFDFALEAVWASGVQKSVKL